MDDNTWTEEVEEICEKIRINCVNLAEYHRNQYYYFKSYGKYFRIPIIILASVNSTASVGLQTFVAQKWISALSCLIGMAIGIMGSIELYLSIQTSMDLEFKQSKDFYTLAIELYKTLHLSREERSENGKEFLNKKFAVYTKLVEASNLLNQKLSVDVLTSIPKKLDYTKHFNTSSFSRTNSSDNLSEKKFEFAEIHSEINPWETQKNMGLSLVVNNETNDDIENNKKK